MLIYLILVIFTAVIYLIRNKITKKLLLFFVIIDYILLTLVAGLRKDIGTDFDLYRGIYNTSFSNYFIEIHDVEVLYVLLNRLFLNADFSFTIFLLFLSAIININYFVGTKSSLNNKVITVFLFVTTGVYFASFNIIRQALVMSFIFLFIRLLNSKKYFSFIILVILLSFFHRSALITLIFIPLMHFKITLKIFLLICFVTIFVLFTPISTLLINLFFKLMPSKYVDLYQYEIFVQDGVNVMNLVLPSLVLGFVLRYYNKLSERKENQLLLNMFILYFLLSIVSTQYLFIYRFSNYFEIVLLLLIPKLLDLTKIKEKWFVDTLIVLVFSLLIVAKLVVGHYGVYPYKH